MNTKYLRLVFRKNGDWNTKVKKVPPSLKDLVKLHKNWSLDWVSDLITFILTNLQQNGTKYKWVFDGLWQEYPL